MDGFAVCEVVRCFGTVGDSAIVDFVELGG